MKPSDLRTHAHAHAFDDYTELRVQENREVRLTMINGALVHNSRAVDGGISARVANAGHWGFCSSPRVSEKALGHVVERASINAQILAQRSKRHIKGFPSTKAKGHFDLTTHHYRRSTGELIDFLAALDAHILQSYPKLSARRLVMHNHDMQKTLLTSEESEAFSMTPRTQIYISMTLEKDGDPVELFCPYGGLGQFEDRFGDPSQLFEGLTEQYEHLENKASGIQSEAGSKTCILGPEVTGVLAHEAIGHTTEADSMMDGSVAAHFMDKQVASPLVTLVDFAHTALGETCPVPVRIDDEGTEAEDCTIIDKGVLRRFMHNKQSAGQLNAVPTGNARAWLFSDEPLIRMRNTAILPGDSTLEEMIASVDDGYYLMRPGDGQAGATSEFVFGVILGYEIKNGKLGRGLRETTMTGVGFDMLKTVSMVSEGLTWGATGWCGKGQPMTVGMGGPAIKCTLNMGGK